MPRLTTTEKRLERYCPDGTLDDLADLPQSTLDWLDSAYAAHEEAEHRAMWAEYCQDDDAPGPIIRGRVIS